jgi:hypothetical protein
VREATKDTYRLVTSHQLWSGRLLSPEEWAFAEFHRIYDEYDQLREEAERTGKEVSTWLDLATAIRTGSVEDANKLLDAVRERWFGPPAAAPGEETGDPAIQAFRNSSALFGYDVRLTEEAGFPDEASIADWLAADADDPDWP